VRGPTPGGGGRGPFGPFGPRRFDHHGGWEWAHALLGLLLVAAIVALIVFLLMRLFERQRPAAAAGPTYAPPRPPAAFVDPALAELRLRYARGEVSRDDFLRISTDLGAPPPPPPPAPPAAPAAPPTPPAGSPPAA